MGIEKGGLLKIIEENRDMFLNLKKSGDEDFEPDEDADDSQSSQSWGENSETTDVSDEFWTENFNRNFTFDWYKPCLGCGI